MAGQAVTDWTTPGAFEVAPGVHRIPLPLPSDALRAERKLRISLASVLEIDQITRLKKPGTQPSSWASPMRSPSGPRM